MNINSALLNNFEYFLSLYCWIVDSFSLYVIKYNQFLQVFYDQANVRQVDVPSFSGSFGILPKHVPTLAVLKPGVVTVFEQSGETKKVFVSSGTITINEDSSVQVSLKIKAT